jgi:hypothetical protein
MLWSKNSTVTPDFSKTIMEGGFSRLGGDSNLKISEQWSQGEFPIRKMSTAIKKTIDADDLFCVASQGKRFHRTLGDESPCVGVAHEKGKDPDAGSFERQVNLCSRQWRSAELQTLRIATGKNQFLRSQSPTLDL